MVCVPPVSFAVNATELHRFRREPMSVMDLVEAEMEESIGLAIATTGVAQLLHHFVRDRYRNCFGLAHASPSFFGRVMKTSGLLLFLHSAISSINAEILAVSLWATRLTADTSISRD